MVVMGSPMAKERKSNNMPVRLNDEALRWARIAASYKGLSLAEYASQVLAEVGKRDVEEGHAALGKINPTGKTKGRRWRQ